MLKSLLENLNATLHIPTDIPKQFLEDFVIYLVYAFGDGSHHR